jgi:hypothetical protein
MAGIRHSKRVAGGRDQMGQSVPQPISLEASRVRLRRLVAQQVTYNPVLQAVDERMFRCTS